MICWLHLRSVDYITRRRKRYASVGELVETTFASQQRYTDACFVAHLRHCSASVNPVPPDPGQWENDIEVIRIKGFADVQTISISAIKKLTAYANGAQIPQLHQLKNQVWKNNRTGSACRYFGSGQAATNAIKAKFAWSILTGSPPRDSVATLSGGCGEGQRIIA